MKDYSSTKVENSKDATIAAIPCYVPCGLELNKIYNESNLDTMKRMPDNFVDLTVTSPPYDNLRKYKGYSFDFENIAKELFRVTKEGGVVVWIVADATINGSESLTSFKQALYFKEIGFNVHDTMIWLKDSIPLNHNRYEQSFEYMFVFSKGKPKTFNPILRKNLTAGAKMVIRKSSFYNEKSLKNGLAKASDKAIRESSIEKNTWYIPVGGGLTADSIAFQHPAIFPEDLAKRHIYTWSNEGDLVYDCFGGSGTVAKMAHLQKRNWILSEISSEYVQIAEKRIAPYLAQTLLF